MAVPVRVHHVCAGAIVAVESTCSQQPETRLLVLHAGGDVSIAAIRGDLADLSQPEPSVSKPLKRNEYVPLMSALFVVPPVMGIVNVAVAVSGAGAPVTGFTS